jgi:hypothetical protein
MKIIYCLTNKDMNAINTSTISTKIKQTLSPIFLSLILTTQVQAENVMKTHIYDNLQTNPNNQYTSYPIYNTYPTNIHLFHFLQLSESLFNNPGNIDNPIHQLVKKLEINNNMVDIDLSKLLDREYNYIELFLHNLLEKELKEEKLSFSDIYTKTSQVSHDRMDFSDQIIVLL